MVYSEGFRARMVQRLLGPDPVSQCALSRETGLSQTTLSRWLRRARSVNGMSHRKQKQGQQGDSESKRPQDWSAEEKLAAVLEAAKLGDEELGAFLRSRGLHEADLVAWRQTVLQALKIPAGKKKSSGLAKHTRKICKLEKELNRKEKALAEAAALLVLQKKVREIWGDEDDDTTGRRGS